MFAASGLVSSITGPATLNSSGTLTLNSVAGIAMTSAGTISIHGIQYSAVDGSSGQVMYTNGAAQLAFKTLDIITNVDGTASIQTAAVGNIAMNAGSITIAANSTIDLNATGALTFSSASVAFTTTGGGLISLHGLSHPPADGTTGQVMFTDGSNTLGFKTLDIIQNVAETSYVKATAGGVVESVATSTMTFAATNGLTMTAAGLTLSTTGSGTCTINATGPLRMDGVLGVELSSVAAIKIHGLTYPAADGSNNQVLETNGAGVLSWVTLSAGDATRITDGSTTYIDTDDTGGTITMFAASGLVSSITGPATLNSSGTLTLNSVAGIAMTSAGAISIHGLTYPAADGTADQVLKTDGAGTLGWVANGGITKSTFTTNLTGASTTIEITCYLMQVGGMVTMDCSKILFTVTSSNQAAIVSDSAMDSAFRPTATTGPQIPWVTISSGTDEAGFIEVLTTGVLKFHRKDNAVWNMDAANCGWYRGCASWITSSF